MHDVFSQRLVTHQPLSDAEQPRAFLLIKTLQGLLVTARAGLQRCFVIKERFVRGQDDPPSKEDYCLADITRLPCSSIAYCCTVT